MPWQENTIHFSDLHQFNTRYAMFSEELEHNEVVLKGLFHHHFDQKGLSVHVGNLIEMYDRTSYAELPPAISITILFQGTVSFSLGAERYQLGNLDEGSVECSAFILNQPEILGRHFKRGMHVRKLNLFIERQWLEERAKTEIEKCRIEQLFRLHTRFHYWHASDAVIALANALLVRCQQNTLQDELLKEAMALQLIAENLDALISHWQADVAQFTQQASSSMLTDTQLKHKIDAMVMQSMALPDMASVMGLSVSTLQRKFKAAYGVTVTNYCRQRRLDFAKKALMVDKKSIGEAAFIAGYTYPSNFVAAFKKRFKLTPSELVATTRQ